MLAVDSSNYAQYDFTPGQLSLWQAAGVGLVIEQALNPPSGYPPERTRQHIGACLDFGLPVGAYVFLWFGAGTGYLQRQLALLEPFVGKLARLWLDVEDTTVGRLGGAAGAVLTQPLPTEHLRRIARQPRPERDMEHVARLAGSMASLQDDVAAWFAVLDQFPTLLGTPGLYSGPWYDRAYVDLSPFANRPVWTAEYDGIADVNVMQPWGGHQPPATLKQFMGSTSLAGYGGIDLSVVSDQEMAALTQPQNPDLQKRIDDLQTALGYVTVDVQAAFRNATKARTKAAETKAVLASADELQRDHDQFLSD